ADARGQFGPAAVQLSRPDADDPFAVAVGVDPADWSGVAAPVETLDGRDLVEGGRSGRAGNCRGRVQPGGQLECGRGRRSLEFAGDAGAEVGHVAEADDGWCL